MKKLLAIILSVLCIFSCFALPASAEGSGGVLGELATTFFERLLGVEMPPEEHIVYGVFYELDPIEGVSVIYKPNPTMSFTTPGIYTITNDTPLSVDYEFIHWVDEDGNRYDKGDEIFVDGQITLYAVWEEKNDNDVRVARIIKTTFEAFRRLIAKFFGILDTFENFEPIYQIEGRYDLSLNKILYEDANYTEKDGNERILLYIDSQNFKETFKRISDEANMDTAEITLCSGWSLETKEPLNNEVHTLSYKFDPLKGPNKEDVLVIETGNIIFDYFNGHSDIEKVYMQVTVGSEEIDKSLYSSRTPENGLDYDEYCTPISVVFTLEK